MTETQQNSRLKAALRLIAVSCLFIISFGGGALAAGMYSIQGISVDKTAASASEARILAVAEGQSRAFATLLRKLTPKSYHSELPSLSDSELSSMVRGIQVRNEKTSAKRYLADLTIEFKRGLVLPILTARDIPYSESISKPLLVLPIFEDMGRKNLWDEPNPWRDAWVEVFDGGRGPEGSLKRQDDWAQEAMLPIVVPSGSLDDMKMVTVEDAIYLREQAITKISTEYGASAVLVAYASLQNQNGVRRLDISYQRSDMLSPAVIESFTGGDTDVDIFRAAIFDVIENLQESWKDQNILDRNIQNRLAVSTDITGLKEWIAIQSKTKSIPSVQALKVREMSVDKVFWEISFVGDLSQLRNALGQKDLVLQNEEGFWTLDGKDTE
ncbi:hypothetical protein A9Q83_08640 [Alphaproteobacteria bacterium 46_93_T64]|nr:hypothetical protein A9Q83_08640 [Alphaproteobacteria bacterium 46_93_T64]